MDDAPTTLLLSGTVNGSPLTHDYWKRAVYRAAPKRFSIETLPPEKQGGQYSYGMRVSPIMSSAASTKSSFMNTTYDIWRRWDDCLWFQDMIESEYSVISAQKRKRLLEGKGVKKNGIYIQDRASSWESLPPGPDPKSVKKDVHEHLPKLTKRGSIFRTSMTTVEQRAAELQALVEAFLADDVPALIQDLRDNRAIRDFFGFWRRDHDLLLKRKPPMKPSSKGKESRASTLSAFSFHLSPSNASVSQYPDVPSSPANSTFSPGRSSSILGKPMADTTNASAASPGRALSPAASVGGASHAGLNARRGFSRGPSSETSESTFKSKRVPDIHVVTVPPPNAVASSSSASSSSSSSGTFSQSGYTRSRAASVPRVAKSFDVSEDFPLFLSSSTRDVSPQSAGPQRPSPSIPSRPRLEALPEDEEVGAPSPSKEVFEQPDTPSGRRRAHSLGGGSNRTTAVFDEAFPQPEADDELISQDASASSPERDRDSTEVNPGLISSAATLSTVSLQSRRSSWRTTPRSRPSSAGSAISGMSNIDIDLSGFIAPSTPPDYYAMRSRHPRKASIITVDSADAVIPRYPHDPEPERVVEEPQTLPREPQTELRVDVRRSMSGRAPAAPRRMRPRSNSQPVPHTPAALDEHFSVAPPEFGSDSGMELDDDFLDAYFTGGSQRNELYLSDEFDEPYEDVEASSAEADPGFLLVPEGDPQDLDVPQTPHTPMPETPGTPLKTRRQEVAMSLSSELFHQPFRSAHSSRVSGLSGVQFHLPFTPPAHTMPELPPFPSTPTTPLPPHEQDRALSVSPPTSPDEIVVVKAVCGDAIVQFRMPRSTSLYDARTRVSDKFTSTEGMHLAPSFALAYVPPMARGLSRAHGSTMSASSGDWSRQSVIGSEDDWRVAVHTCGPKLVLRIGNGEAGSP
ncbi:hypothetical protein PENSPDRAFT_738564 [Peniophora sp. CONT]|nr:hypothetical protein PENSPDRAFT_738564 [Peniophora sp. CONT]